MNLTVTDNVISEHDIRHAIEHASHLLPAQGPITVFIHHNTLHGLEHLPFEEAVRRAHELFGTHAYLPEEQYRRELASGRIRPQDIVEELLDTLGPKADILVGFLGTRFHLRRAMLRHPLHSVLPNQLDWVIAESRSFDQFSSEVADQEKKLLVSRTRRWIESLLVKSDGEINQEQKAALERCGAFFRKHPADKIHQWNDATWESFTLHLLWETCLHRVAEAPSEPAPESLRHRDVLFDLTGIDTDELVSECLIPFCLNAIDQGLGQWQLPYRNLGLFEAFVRLFSQRQPLSASWTRGLARELKKIQTYSMSALDSIQESLQVLGVHGDEIESFIVQSLQPLRGFAGMIWQMEVRADRIAHPLPKGSLTDFVAIRLLLDRAALTWVAQQHLDHPVDLADLRKLPSWENSADEGRIRCEAFAIFQLAQSLGWLPESLLRIPKQNWLRLLEEIRMFDEIERQRVFHRAFERRYRNQVLDALAIHGTDQRFVPPPKSFENNTTSKDDEAHENSSPSPRFDVVTCLDEREESTRRHIEEIEPHCRTWGGAGFYGAAMYYRGAASFQYVPLCPIVVEPKHYVEELVALDHAEEEQRRSQLRRIVGETRQWLHSSSRSLWSGAAYAVVGWLMSIPLVAQVLFPRLSSSIRDRITRFSAVTPNTLLRLERSTPEPGRFDDQVGYSLNEMVDLVEKVLRDLGMTKNWSRLVVVLGHGATTMNNPHESAYNCGACGGGRGGPNARVFTQMANDLRVRSRLESRGLKIPETTFFVGGFHDTCSDQIGLLDLARVPASHHQDIRHAQKVLHEAAQRNALERCRRFESAPLDLTPAAAHKHVVGRSEDLSQVRPECGHATNAVCIVGRREKTRGLFMDRRVYLQSYEPDQDDEDFTILGRILAAVIPVCAGINLEYYFSRVDTEGYGCGTKVPHNIASLVGVMNGAASDLRTGLPWQMVEIHEPVRLLMVIEAPPEAIQTIMARDPAAARLIHGRWIQLVLWNADQGQLQRFHNGHFVEYVPEAESLPQAADSIAWFRGHRDHLEFAQLASSHRSEGTR